VADGFSGRDWFVLVVIGGATLAVPVGVSLLTGVPVFSVFDVLVIVFLAACIIGIGYRLRSGATPPPASGCVMTVAASSEQLDLRIERALGTIASNSTQVSPGVWIGSARPSWRTFGDRIAIAAREAGGHIEATVVSWTPGLAVVAYGKNRANVRAAIATLDGQHVVWMDRAARSHEIAWLTRLREDQAR
jgi:hypothetical protein